MTSTEASSQLELADYAAAAPPKAVASESAVYRPKVDTTGIDSKKLMRKIDIHVIPWLALLYLLNFLDRGTVGNASLYGMRTDLKISDQQYLIALVVFFFPYSLAEPISNVLLKRLRPSRWLSTLTFIWGTITVCHGVIENYGGLITVRVLLGLAEAGLYPGIVYYISCWYKRSELGSRVAWFFSSATVAGAFSGLLAAAIQQMDGVGGKAGWQWIFILEGLVTAIVGVLSFWVIADFPDIAKFLNDTERVWIVRRLQDDMQFSAGGEKFDKKYIYQSLRDWKTWFGMVIYAAFDGPLFAFSLFTPSIINELGFTATTANLLSVPVYAWACIMTLVIGALGDQLGSRGYINIALFGVGLVGYIILIVSKTPALSYFAVYLAASAIYPTIPNSVAWLAGNVEGSYKRSVTLALAIGFGNLQGSVTSNIYRARDKPYYRLGHGIVLMYIAIGFIASAGFTWMLRRENTKRDRGERDEVIRGVDNPNAKEVNGVYDSLDECRRDRGDYYSKFRYTV